MTTTTTITTITTTVSVARPVAYLTDDEGLLCLHCWGIGGPSVECPRCHDTLRDCLCEDGIPQYADELGADATCDVCGSPIVGE